ncbi:hypothetical protein RUM43_009075 [Polyplax serrata]|uniref:Exocyst complex component Sec6 n=1 Tax=Polyplax serrata TaxID=468196 RepID=A0AAN8S1T9_POLSC
MEELEAEAKAKGTKYVMGILQRPGQLEKLDQYKRRVSRKKASVETQLKTALQSQLDGVREGLKLLQVAQNDMKEIKTNMSWVQKSIANIPDLVNQLHTVKEENMRHSQYETAKHNLKHIFTVPDSVRKTKNWINEGKLLYARQSLADLENSRDDLLFELHKLPQTSQADRVMLQMYFDEVGQLSEMMKKQVCLILGRTLNTVRKDPTIIVTTLRIIEGEEKADAFHEIRRKQTNFCSPGRPKRWKAMALAVLEEGVAQRIEGTQTDERENHKMWLVRHLELTRLLILEDLRVVKTLCALCFPPSWNIVDNYVRMYHRCLSNHFKEIIQKGLIGNENVSLLSWCLNTYPGTELMSHPELSIDVTQYEPLLSEELIDDLQMKYLADVEANYVEWMGKTLEKEKEDWMKAVPPEDDAGYYQTSAPDIVFQIVNQNLEVARTVSQKLTDKVLLLSMEQAINFAKLYGEAILQLKNKHFADRSQNPFYTQHMISVVNNCMQFREFAGQWKPDIRTKETVKVYEKLIHCYLEVRNEAVKYLLTEAFRDLYLHFNDLFTTKWQSSSAPVDTICLTFEDYFQDYVHLKVENFEYVISFAQTHVAKCFIYKIMQGKIGFSNYEERKAATNKIKSEIIQIKGFFHRIAPNVKIDQNFDLIDPLVEIIRVQDPEMLLLDLHELVGRFSDITETQLECLLMIRGDLKRSEVRDKVSYILSSRTNQPKDTLLKKSIFSFIGRGNVSMDWDAYWAEYLN